MGSSGLQIVFERDLHPPEESNGHASAETSKRYAMKYWYKPKISRDDAVSMLKDQPAGTFVVRESNSFQNAFALALKVDKPPPGVRVTTPDGIELVRHYLIETTPAGVKVKGCSNEHVYGSLSALIIQHSLTPMSLPCKLVLPTAELDTPSVSSNIDKTSLLMSQQLSFEDGISTKALLIHVCETEALAGAEAVRRAVDDALDVLKTNSSLEAVNVVIKVASSGITISDLDRKHFFRIHFAPSLVKSAFLDPCDRRWHTSSKKGERNADGSRLFGVITQQLVDGILTTANTCRVFAELPKEKPASAMVALIKKMLVGHPA